ncbi:MAG: polyphosphate:AMP phosphotransferase [Planctomycetota bacterium]|jgi:polyphosphate:AMP phosphotransferase
MSVLEVGKETVSKEEFAARVPQLRVDLLNAQFELRDAGFPVLVVIAGNDRWGVSRVTDRLLEWLDPRHVGVRVFEDPTEEERQRPRMWRFWNALPPAGRIGVALGAWPVSDIGALLRDEIGDAAFERRMDHARRFEEMLVDDGALVLKYWLRLPWKAFRKRLKKAEKDPDRYWHVEDADWRIYEAHERVTPTVDRYLARTGTQHAPWSLLDSTDRRTRDLAVATTLLEAIRDRLDARSVPSAARAVLSDPWPPGAPRHALASVDLTATILEKDYDERLERQQARIGRLTRTARKAGLASVLLFEGWDAAGKGGVIRRLTAAMAAPDYRIVPIAAPTDEEKAHHYLWRFWRQLPRAGKTVIFDRTWYGRVLVERVEGFASEDAWRRAYAEIEDFEQLLVEHGIVLQKFWLHIDPDEQARRFAAREQTPYKKYKITDEDYRNRERWDDYVDAIDEMVARTSTAAAPWTLVPANDKRAARIQVLEVVGEALESGLKRRRS